MTRGRLVDILTRLGVLLLIAVHAAPASAQAGMTGRAIPVCIARATPSASAATLFAGRTAVDCRTDQTKFGPGDYWALSPPLGENGAVRVRIASLWNQRVTLVAHYADGHDVTRQLDGHGITRAIQLGAIVEQPLPARAVPLTRLAWHVEGAANLRGILLGARLATPEESSRSNLLMASLYAAFAGLATALLIYNLALWGALRHRFQFAYCAMLGALLVYACSSSGALAWWWPTIANNDRLRINYAALAASAVAAMAFARTFFEPRVFVGRLSRAMLLAGIALGAATVAWVTLAPWHIALLDRLYNLAFIAQLAVVLPLLWRGWRLRSDYLWIFAIGWAAPIALAVARIANALDWLGWNFWIDNSTLATMSLEALLSSLAIAYRIKQLSRERDLAREQEIAARLLADVDPLTGLLNRRAFLERAIGQSGDYLLLVADLDHFKAVNDTIGHDGGDEVLRLFARVLRQSVPGGGLIARMGGEEFAMLVPAQRPVDGDDVLARLRTTRMPFDLTVTASIGSAIGPLLNEADWKALYRAADRALFDAKAAGRDRLRRRATDRAAA